MPLQKLENGAWPHPARLPLGAGWSGHCTAPGHEGESPSQNILESSCNLGYASSCAWTPAVRPWDAVRFAVAAPAIQKTSSTSLAQTLRLAFVCERDHRPASNGELEFDLTRATWTSRHDDPRIQRMAECFLETYLKKRD
jgi:hypothetical protein